MSAPEVGRVYDVTMRGRVATIESDGSLFLTVDGIPRFMVYAPHVATHTWVEVEPEYVVGALYEDAEGNVWRRREPDDDGPWVEARNGGYFEDSDVPKRPLTRLYREGEVPS